MASNKDWTILTRATLLARLKDVDDHKSWQEFFDTYAQLIYSVAIQRGLNGAEAQDAVQETMVAVARHMPGFKYDPQIGSFKSWLLQMARWRITDQFKKRPRGAVELQAESDQDEPGAVDGAFAGSEFEKLWDEEWSRNLLNVAVGKVRRRLNPRQYQAYDLYVNKELAPDRVAELLAISVDQVYLAKHRVTDAIKQEVLRIQKEIV